MLWIMFGIVVIVLLNFNRFLFGFFVIIFVFLIFFRYCIVGDIFGIVGVFYLMYFQLDMIFFVLLKVFVIIYVVKVFFLMVKIFWGKVFVEEVLVEEFYEWDIFGEIIYEFNGEVKCEREGIIERFKRVFLIWDFFEIRLKVGRVVVLLIVEGFIKEQIEELKKFVEEGKLENRFLRKKVMFFVFVIFFGFLISYFWGDIFWWLEFKMMGF